MPSRCDVICGLACAATLGCDIDLERMIDQPRYDTYERCEVCPDGTSMLEIPEGTVSRDEPMLSTHLETGFDEQGWLEEVPVDVDERVLRRGQDRFDIFCAACHGKLGTGVTQVAENMRLREPPSLIVSPIRDYPPGRIYMVVSQGFGLMPSYAEELEILDRWAVVAYLEALQLSQRVRLEALPPSVREEAEGWLK